MKYIYLFLMMTISAIGHTQSQKILILDSLNHNPVANVFLKTANEKIYYSDIDGKISIKNLDSGYVHLLHINYKPKSIFIDYNKGTDTLFITKKMQVFAEVKIIGNNKTDFNYKHIGYFDDKTSKTLISNQLSITAVYIPYSKVGNRINKILLKIKTLKNAESYNVYLSQIKMVNLGQ